MAFVYEMQGFEPGTFVLWGNFDDLYSALYSMREEDLS